MPRQKKSVATAKDTGPQAEHPAPESGAAKVSEAETEELRERIEATTDAPTDAQTAHIAPDQPDIAERAEVLHCLTSVMRGQDISRSQARAAEVLARILGLYTDGTGGSAPPPRIVDDIPEVDGDGARSGDADCDAGAADEDPG